MKTTTTCTTKLSLCILYISAAPQALYSMEHAPKKHLLAHIQDATQESYQETAAAEQVSGIKKKTKVEDTPLTLTRVIINNSDLPSTIQQTFTLKMGHAPIGRICFSYNQRTHHGYIDNLRVNTQYRRRGFGSQLMQQALAELRSWDCREVELCASPDKAIYLKELIAFYTAFGFHLDTDSTQLGDNAILMTMNMPGDTENKK